MRFTRLAAVVALPLLAVATPWGSPTTTPGVTKTVIFYFFPLCVFITYSRVVIFPFKITITETATATSVSQCNVGSIQCCDSTTTSDNPLLDIITGLLG